MDCEDARDLLHAYADNELDAMTSRELEAHLRDCPGCARAFAADRAVKTVVANPALLHTAPAALRDRLLASGVFSSLSTKTEHERVRIPRRMLALAASLMIVAGLTWFLLSILARPGANALVAQAALASHLRSLQADAHLLDVQSTDQHTVKPWFAGRVDFAPPVRDLAGRGFPLMGGRLDFLRDRPVVALVYRRNKHVINLFIWPGESGKSDAERQGYHLVHWSDGGMTFWAVSDLNAPELHQFADLFRAESSPATKP
jgi:mycothiol system anti-sigma-R factor